MYHTRISYRTRIRIWYDRTRMVWLFVPYEYSYTVLLLFTSNIYIAITNIVAIAICLRSCPQYNTRSSTSNKLCHMHLFLQQYTSQLLFQSLPKNLEFTSTNQLEPIIKHLVRSAMWNHFLCNFNPDDPCTFHFKCTCRNCYFSAPETNFKYWAMSFRPRVDGTSG